MIVLVLFIAVAFLVPNDSLSDNKFQIANSIINHYDSYHSNRIVNIEDSQHNNNNNNGNNAI